MSKPVRRRHWRYQDIHGRWQKLVPVSLAKREELRGTLLELSEWIAALPAATEVDSDESHNGLSFSELYDRDSYFRELVDECLRLGGVDPNRCSMDMAVCFLLPHQGQRQGLLMELNFSAGAEGTGSGKKRKELTYAELLAVLWGAMDSFAQAIEAADSIPADQLLEILEARAAALKDIELTPEEKHKKEQQRLAKEAIMADRTGVVGDEVDVDSIGLDL